MKKVVINAVGSERRLAVLEDNQLDDLYVFKRNPEGTVGDIFKGRVVNVLPGMQAAFVDIGVGKNGYLHRDDLAVFKPLSESEKKRNPSISQFIHQGQEVIVQVVKESISTKGPKLTELIEVPGRYSVYLPNSPYIAVSKKITDEKRFWWKDVGASLCEKDEGIIIRTGANEVGEEIVKREWYHLKEQWMQLLRSSHAQKTPSVLSIQDELYSKVALDINLNDVDELLVDDPSFFRKLKEYEEFANKLTLYNGKEHLFSAFHIESHIEKLLLQSVRLKSGAFLSIDHTEAMTIIDVNTGKFVGKTSLKETVLKTNIEAAKEVARQLRLRDIGGIIVIDFIDMKDPSHQIKVIKILNDALVKDRTHTKVLGFTKLGLLEMTRKRVRESVVHSLTSTCPSCEGSGVVISSETIAYRIERALWECKNMDEEAILIEAPRDVFSYLDQERIKQLERQFGFQIFITAFEGSHDRSFNIRQKGSINDIKKRIKKNE